MFIGGLLVSLLCLPADVWAHEIVGEVTPLMVHMKQALILIANGKDKEAFRQIKMVYEDFSHDMGMGMVMEGTGLKETVARIDSNYETTLGKSLSNAIESGNTEGLLKTIQTTAYLLMLEKFDVLQSTLSNKEANFGPQKTMFWLGRNYFSYLLEPTLARRDPIEEKRLDRLLDRMLYRLEDGEWKEFQLLRMDLENGLIIAFNLDLSTLMHTGSRAK
jgi:hypothetical protein